MSDVLEDGQGGAQRARRCETLAQLTVEMRKLLALWKDDVREDDEGRASRRRRFVLVLDGVDRQRDAPPTMIPALARLAEIVRSSSTLTSFRPC